MGTVALETEPAELCNNNKTCLKVRFVHSLYSGCVHTYVLDTAELVCVEDKNVQCEAVTKVRV